MKKLIAILLSLLFIVSLLDINTFAHPHTLNVEYEECSKEENIAGENELWYSINELGGMAPEISNVYIADILPKSISNLGAQCINTRIITYGKI